MVLTVEVYVMVIVKEAVIRKREVVQYVHQATLVRSVKATAGHIVRTPYVFLINMVRALAAKTALMALISVNPNVDLTAAPGVISPLVIAMHVK